MSKLKQSVKPPLKSIAEFRRLDYSPQSIPKIMHRIWFGSVLPEKYRNYLQKLAADNPEYRVKLWTDFSIISSAEENELSLFCQKDHIELEDIRQHSHLINHQLITCELDKSRNKIKNRRIHFARASDLARIAILIEHGGIYTDTDTQSLKKLPILEAPYGVFLKEVPGMRKEDQQYLNEAGANNVFYDFIAAAPANRLLSLAAEISEIDYKTYSEGQHTEWENSNSRHVQQVGNIRLTGSALRWACHYLVSHQQIRIEPRADLFFADFGYLFSDYDTSWLEQSNAKATRQHRVSLLLFMDKIEKERARHFPLNFDYTVKEFALKAERSLTKLKHYAVNVTVLRAISELQELIEHIKSVKLSEIQHENPTDLMNKKEQLGIILDKINQLNDSCFEGKENGRNLVSVLRRLFNEITFLFTGTKDNSNWLAEKIVKRPFFLVNPRTQSERDAIELNLDALDDAQDVAKKLFTS